MTAIEPIDLAAAMIYAVELAKAVGQPPVIAGGLALAAHGYRRETTDVDIAVPVTIGAPSGDVLEDIAHGVGLATHARHSFGGVDLRAPGIKVDVLTLDRHVPTLVPDAVAEAVASDRQAVIFGQQVYVVSLGHLVTMKLVAERRKDEADLIELLKVRMEGPAWPSDYAEIQAVITTHIGKSSVAMVDKLIAIARRELRRN